QPACARQRYDPASSFTRSRVASMAAGPSGTPPKGRPLMTPTSVSLSTKTSFTKFAWPRLAGQPPAAILSTNRREQPRASGVEVEIDVVLLHVHHEHLPVEELAARIEVVAVLLRDGEGGRAVELVQDDEGGRGRGGAQELGPAHPVPPGPLGALLGDQPLGELLPFRDPARDPLHVGDGMGGKRHD